MDSKLTPKPTEPQHLGILRQIREILTRSKYPYDLVNVCIQFVDSLIDQSIAAITPKPRETEHEETKKEGS